MITSRYHDLEIEKTSLLKWMKTCTYNHVLCTTALYGRQATTSVEC